MALDWFGEMVNKTAWHLGRGDKITQQDRQYWANFDSPSLLTRRQVLDEARRLVSLSESFAPDTATGTLQDAALSAGITDYSPIGPGAQPAGANVYVTVVGKDVTGANARIAISHTFSWDTTRATIEAQVLLMAYLSRSPPLDKGAAVDWGSLIIR